MHSLACVPVPSLHAVVVWQTMTVVNKYENPSTTFSVSVRKARSISRFEPLPEGLV